MRSRIFLSYAELPERVEDVAGYAQELGMGISGRFVPVGGALELVPDLRQQLRASDAVIAIFGSAAPSDFVKAELEWSYEDAKGLVGVRLDRVAAVPNLLHEAGAEILDWADEEDRSRLDGAVQAAIRGARLMERARLAGTGSGAACGRPMPRRE
jgi:hypothetical protein